jgi:two-component system cell cycle sensor histidine kinase/response regulator CckA
LLDFGRRQVVVETKPVNLSNIVQHTEALLERLLGPQTTLQLNLNPDLWDVIADPEQMTQVLMNLCLNARDAMPQGGTVEIETRNVADGGRLSSTQAKKVAGPAVLLTVRDNGTGMSPAVREKIFEPFFTTKERGKGTGLGLAIVSGIVKQCGGFIDVRSKQGEGTAFNIYIPRDSQHGGSDGEIQRPK